MARRLATRLGTRARMSGAPATASRCGLSETRVRDCQIASCRSVQVFTIRRSVQSGLRKCRGGESDFALPSVVDHHRRGQRPAVVVKHLRQRIRAAVQQRQHFAWLQRPQAAFDSQANVLGARCRNKRRPNRTVARQLCNSSSCGSPAREAEISVVVPLVIIHREHDVVAGIGQQPHVARFRTLLDVAAPSSAPDPASAMTLRPGSSRIVAWSSRCSALGGAS